MYPSSKKTTIPKKKPDTGNAQDKQSEKRWRRYIWQKNQRKVDKKEELKYHKKGFDMACECKALVKNTGRLNFKYILRQQIPPKETQKQTILKMWLNAYSGDRERYLERRTETNVS